MKKQRPQKKSYRTFEIYKHPVNDTQAAWELVSKPFVSLSEAEDAASDMSLTPAGENMAFWVCSDKGKQVHSFIVYGAVFGVERYDPEKHG